MKRKAGWLLLVCLISVGSSLLLPASSAERSSVISTEESFRDPQPTKGSKFSIVPKRSDLSGMSWLAAPAPMPMTALAPFIDLQENGLTTVVDGVGLIGWDHTTPQNLTVNVGGPVRFALLYWAGQDDNCPAAGATCDPPPPIYKDSEILFNSVAIGGTVIGTETSTSTTPSKVNNIGYFADVTSIVSAAGVGLHSFPFDDGNEGSNLASLKGVSLVVAYTNAADPALYRVIVWDGLDYAFAADPTPGDARTTAPITFNHGAKPSARTAALTVIAGDGEAAKADEITVSNNPTLFNALNSSDDNDGWDTDTFTINIPATVGNTVVQINSPAATPDEFLWEVSMLRVSLADTEEPTCTHSETAGPPKVVTFIVEDNDSGIAEILVTKSENADTVVPPFTVGTTDPVTITSTKIDQTQKMSIEIRITDVAGNVRFCDYDDGCLLTCPANITQSNDPNQCGAVVNYPAPTTTGTCGAVTCSPASGSFFPVGTTTVTCEAAGGDPACTFTVTVNDTQPPLNTCPANQTVTGAPDTTSATGTFPPPTASDNCPGVTTICTPASGSAFPQGTTTVSCTATDASGNNATCSFTLTVNIPPGANNDHYFTFLNQSINIAAPGVLSNDGGFPSPTAVPNGGATTAGGTFSLNADGSFSYTPPAGFTGNDGFNYTATNTAGSDMAHVTLTVTDPATISLRISEFRENGPGTDGPFPAMKSPFNSDKILVETLQPSKDEFIEIYNHTPTDVQVGTTIPTNNGGLGVFASAGNGVTDNVVTLVCRIPDGTIIRAKGYVLCTNRGFGGGYSLDFFGTVASRTGGSALHPISGPGFTAVGDFPIINGTAEHPGAFTSVDIPNDAGLLLANVGTNTVGASSNVPDNGDFGFGATGISPLSFTVYDRIGFAPYGSGAPLQTCQLANTAGCGTSGSARPSLADNYCEGGPTGCLRPVGDASTTNHGATVFYGDSGQYSLLRRQTTLNADGTAPQDTNNNVQDILMVAPKPGINIAFNITNFPTGGTNGLVSVLGAAGPQNRNAPPDLPDPGVLQSRLFDSGRTLNQLPNAERRYVIDNGGSPENAGNMNTTIQANNPLGSFIFRFGFRNVSSETLQQLRFRVDQLAVPCGQASPSPATAVTGSGNARNLSQTSPNCQGSDTQTAVLKVLNMPTELVSRESVPSDPPETVRGSVIEDSGNFPGGIEMAPNGGGINNSLVRTGTAQGSFIGEYSTVVPAAGPYFYIGFRLGVVKGGSFKFIIQPEGLPSPVPVSDGVLVRSKTKE